MVCITMSVFRRCMRLFKSWPLKHYRGTSQTVKEKREVIDDVKHPSIKATKSAVYVVTRSGHGGVLALVEPVLDFDNILGDTDKLKVQLSHRNVHIDVERLVDGWRKLKILQEKSRLLVEEKEQVAEELRREYKNGSNNRAELLKEKGKWIRKEIKNLKEKLCDIEEDIIVPAFKTIPNIIHQDTPMEHERVIHEGCKKPAFYFMPKSHIEIGHKTGEIILLTVSPGAFYLRGKAALCEFEIQQFFSNHLLRANFRPFSNPDFSKPLIAEACAMDPFNGSDILTIQSKDVGKVTKDLFTSLHLTGSASLAAFCAYHTRTVVSSDCLWPLRYFAVGRHYKPLVDGGGGIFDDLLNVTQSSRVHFFIATENVAERGIEAYRSTLWLLIDIYSTLGLHFRVVNIPAKDLQKPEMLRTSLQMWLPALQKYTEVGYIAVCGDYISKRLLCQYQDDQNNKNYLYMVHGVAVDVTRILACVIENTQTEQGEWSTAAFDERMSSE